MNRPHERLRGSPGSRTMRPGESGNIGRWWTGGCPARAAQGTREGVARFLRADVDLVNTPPVLVNIEHRGVTFSMFGPSFL